MDRRKFVTTTSLAGAAGLLAACSKPDAGSAGAQVSTAPKAERFEWKMVTTWPRDFPGLGTGVNRFAESVEQLSNGRLKIKVYGGNELVPPFEVFDAVQQGTAEMGHGASYYWKGRIPATQIFSGVPFGMTSHELNGWYFFGGGLEIYQEAYAPHGVIPFVMGNTGVQMGGWFNKEINGVSDLAGLKMRIPGLGGEVLKRAGGTPVNVPGSELFTALQSGTIDAAEWIGPYNDLAFGLFRAAKYYYYPGWQEPGTGLECLINAEAWASLPPDLQEMVKIACKAGTLDVYSEFEAMNGAALQTLVEEHGVELRAFPDEVLEDLKRHTTEALDYLAAEDEWTGRAWASMKAYTEQIRPWTNIGERYYLDHCT
ncbi:MAG TPA: TRAP transporter substrate-binding protein [Xanthomonadales bacterium]|nr:TRAP transporter substrate-binding protein [Xanthomonadales bacterium]